MKSRSSHYPHPCCRSSSRLHNPFLSALATFANSALMPPCLLDIDVITCTCDALQGSESMVFPPTLAALHTKSAKLHVGQAVPRDGGSLKDPGRVASVLRDGSCRTQRSITTVCPIERRDSSITTASHRETGAAMADIMLT